MTNFDDHFYHHLHVDTLKWALPDLELTVWVQTQRYAEETIGLWHLGDMDDLRDLVEDGADQHCARRALAAFADWVHAHPNDYQDHLHQAARACKKQHGAWTL